MGLQLHSNSYSVPFEQQDFEWKLLVNGKEINHQYVRNTKIDYQSNYWIHVMILDTNTTKMTYNVDLCLMSPNIISSIFLKSFQVEDVKKKALDFFRNIQHSFQKEFSLLEFPHFPEGN